MFLISITSLESIMRFVSGSLLQFDKPYTLLNFPSIGNLERYSID